VENIGSVIIAKHKQKKDRQTQINLRGAAQVRTNNSTVGVDVNINSVGGGKGNIELRPKHYSGDAHPCYQPDQRP
jgi:hypothetical protein